MLKNLYCTVSDDKKCVAVLLIKRLQEYKLVRERSEYGYMGLSPCKCCRLGEWVSVHEFLFTHLNPLTRGFPPALKSWAFIWLSALCCDVVCLLPGGIREWEASTWLSTILETLCKENETLYLKIVQLTVPASAIAMVIHHKESLSYKVVWQ